MPVCSDCGVNGGCGCLFTRRAGRLLCGLCSGVATLEKAAEIRYLRERQGIGQQRGREEKNMALKSVLAKQMNGQQRAADQKSDQPKLNANDMQSTMRADRRRMRIFHSDGEPASMHNILAGRPAFLICGGPSLNKMDLSLLNQRGIVTMGVNNSPALFKPNYWICGDTPRRFIEQIWKDPTITKFVPHGHRNIFPRVRTSEGGLKNSAFRTFQMPNTYFFNRGEWFDAKYFFEDRDFPWGTDSKTPDAYGIHGYRSTMILAIKMLWYLGAGNVYLLGCDFKMENGAQNYAFEQDRTPQAVRENTEVFKALDRRLKELKPYLKHTGLNIFNCTPDSGLKLFPYMDYRQAIKKAAAECNEKPIMTEGMYEESN